MNGMKKHTCEGEHTFEGETLPYEARPVAEGVDGEGRLESVVLLERLGVYCAGLLAGVLDDCAVGAVGARAHLRQNLFALAVLAGARRGAVGDGLRAACRVKAIPVGGALERVGKVLRAEVAEEVRGGETLRNRRAARLTPPRHEHHIHLPPFIPRMCPYRPRHCAPSCLVFRGLVHNVKRAQSLKC
eukprot:2081149-Pleurochrysis_carterae.AAC.1